MGTPTEPTEPTPAPAPATTTTTPAPSTPAPAPTQPTPAQQNDPSFREMMAAVNALPEKLVDSFREAFQSQAPKETTAPAKTESTQQATSETSTQTVEPGKKRSLAHWWFGG